MVSSLFLSHSRGLRPASRTAGGAPVYAGGRRCTRELAHPRRRGGARARCCPCPPAPTTFPTDVTVQAFLKPEGQRLHLLVRVPLRRPARRGLSHARAGLPGPRAVDASLRHAAKLWIADQVELYEDDVRLAPPADRRRPRVAAVRPELRHLRGGAGPRHGRAAAGRHGRSSGARGCSTSWLEYPIRSERSRLLDRIPAWRGSGSAWSPSCASCRRTARCAPSSSPAIPGSSGSIRDGIRPRFASSRSGFLHILDGTDHLLFLLVPGDPVPPAAPARPGRHGVHPRALGHADRVRLRPGARTRSGSRPSWRR